MSGTPGVQNRKVQAHAHLRRGGEGSRELAVQESYGALSCIPLLYAGKALLKLAGYEEARELMWNSPNSQVSRQPR